MIILVEYPLLFKFLSQISFSQHAVLPYFTGFFCLGFWISVRYVHIYLEPHFQDDDSDLECELEALPPVSVESASEAAACVKVHVLALVITHFISISYALGSCIIIVC